MSKAATIGNSQVVFTGIEKVNAIIDKSSGSDVPLTEISLDSLHVAPSRTEPPKFYAIYSTGTSTVTIQVDCVPTTTFTLYADGIANLSTISGNQSPAFPESFHDILVFGALADEYRKMEKVPLARDAEGDFERRLSDLRMFIAKSAYIDIYQGTNNTNTKWWN